MRARGRSDLVRLISRFVAIVSSLVPAIWLCAPSWAATPGAVLPADPCGPVWYVTVPPSGASGASFGRVAAGGAWVAVGALPIGSAALAVDRSSPSTGYFIGYTGEAGPDGILHRLDLSTGASSVIDPVPLPMFRATRLATAPDGQLWTLTVDGHLWSTRATPVSVGLPVDHGRLAGTVLSGGSGGDLAFDGLGNLWLINTAARLYTISAADLASPAPQARLIGDAHVPNASGLAFAGDGTLMAASSSTGDFYTLDPTTAVATRTVVPGPGQVGDLASCAAPKPQLTATKSVSATHGVHPSGELTYTIRLHNSGSLAAITTALRDAIPTHTRYLAGSARLDGSPVPDASGTFPYAAAGEVHTSGAGPGILAPGGVATVSFAVRVDARLPAGVRQISNQGLVFYGGGPGDGLRTDDPLTAVPGDPTVTPVIGWPPPGVPKLIVSKSADHVVARPGEVVRYTITASNAGTGAFTNDRPARISDDLTQVLDDATYNYDEVADGGSLLSFSGNTLRWAGALAPGRTVRVSYSIRIRGVGGDGRLVNIAVADSGNCLAGSGDARCATLVRVLGAASTAYTVATSSDLAGGAMRVGQQIAVRVLVSNATDGVVQAAVDQDLGCLTRRALVGAATPPSSPLPTFGNGHLRWSGELAGRQSVLLTYSLTVLDPSVIGCLRPLLQADQAGSGEATLARTGPAGVLRDTWISGALLLFGSFLTAVGIIGRRWPRTR